MFTYILTNCNRQPLVAILEETICDRLGTVEDYVGRNGIAGEVYDGNHCSEPQWATEEQEFQIDCCVWNMKDDASGVIFRKRQGMVCIGQ